MSKLQRHVQCYDAYAPLEMIQRCIREGHHVMVLMRGIPGSGKTHLAKMLSSNYGGMICSTDDFFIENGEYRFQPEKLEEYHRNNILRVREAMKDGIKPIIVDNTNIFTNHMEQYAFHAVTHCYEIFVVEPETSWKYAVKECFKRNVHGVEKSKIRSMLQSLEEQGRPSLSRLVGKGRQIRLDPPYDVIENSLIAPVSSMGLADFASTGASGSPSSVEVSASEGPPGLPDPKASNILAKLFPQNVDIATTTSCTPQASLSLAPDPRTNVQVITLRDMATQTNEVIVTLSCAGVPCLVEDFVEGPSHTVERVKEPKIHVKDRVVRMENIPQVSELDVLIAIFPFENVNDLTHYYQMMGFDGCVNLFVELGAYVDWSASVVEGTFVEELAAAEISATIPHAPPPRTDWQRIAEQEGMDISDKSARMSPTELPRSALPQANTITVTLSVDILQKMSVLFGNGMSVEEEYNLSVPLWLLEQLYLIWEKDVRRNRHDSDVELASFLQEDEHKEAMSEHEKKQMTVAQKLNLNELVNEFSPCDSECVRRVFEDNKYDAVATRVTLRIMLNPDEEIENLEQTPSTSTQAPKQASPRLLPDTRPRTEVNLALAQEQALEYQRQADKFAVKRSVETRKAQGYIRSGLVPAATVHQQFAREHAVQERNLREKAADIIFKAHENSSFLDLHLLSQRDALTLLRERLELLDRPESMRNGRSDRRLRVITGYGKNSGGRAVLKPAVESYLKKRGYIYCFMNMGEIMIHCK